MGEAASKLTQTFSWQTLAGAWIVYALSLCAYRVFFSPVRHIPGPLIARMTYLYEFYYDVICVGQYIWKIQELHEVYGPVVRINPHEVHIFDGDYFDELYTGAHRKRDKWFFQSGILDLTESVFGSLPHETHRLRRAALNPFFSQAKVRSLQNQIEEMIQRLLATWDACGRERKPILLSFAMAALANDVATQYSFGHNDHRIDAPDYDRAFTQAMDAGAYLGHVLKHLPWLYTLSLVVPSDLQSMFGKGWRDLIRAKDSVQAEVTSLHARRHDPDVKADSTATIFHGLLTSSLPESEKSPDRLWQDGYVTVSAGTLTTANTLSLICFWLLRQPSNLRILKEELETAVPDAQNIPPVSKLEQLPFLTAVIKEGLRVTNGITFRSTRIPREEDLVYTVDATETSKKSLSYVLPHGTPISMTSLDIHLSSRYFEEPHRFHPQRWLGSSASGLEKYLVPFSRGTRMCAGMNLAWTELYLTIAMVFTKYGSLEVRSEGQKWLELHETDEEDLKIVGDGSGPFYRRGDRVKVLVHGV